MEQVKEGEGEGGRKGKGEGRGSGKEGEGGRKETLADQPLHFENRPLCLYAQVCTLLVKFHIFIHCDLCPSIAEVNFEPTQTLSCQIMNVQLECRNLDESE